MKKIKNLASWTTRLFTAVMVIVCGMVIVSCNKDMDVNEGLSVVKRSPATNNSPLYGGIKIINDSLQEDSIPYEGVIYKTTLKRSIKALDRREVVVENFDNQTFDETFTAVQGEEKYARQDGKFLIYGRETIYKKNVSVAGHVEEVSYTLYQERAILTLNSYKFDYIEWNVRNASDEFTAALISTMDKKNELDYKNGIATSYYGYNQNASEVIAWFSDAEPQPEPQKPTYETTSDIKYTTTYVSPSWEKIQINPDGSRETVEKDAANLPISVTPETNWTINVDKLGTYVSNSFNKTLISKTPRKVGNFSYNEYTYRVYNTVAGQTNSLLVKVPGDIVREKDDERQEYQTTELIVTKGTEATTFSTETSTNKVYKYNVVANVTYGATQQVNLPGTVNVKKEVSIDHYEVTGDRNDHQTFTSVTYEKFAVHTDGTRKSTEKDSENLPIRIVPETNWTINVDNLGTYVSNAFAKTLISKTPRKQGNFSYNEYCYRVYNTVAGQTNSFLVYVPNDIVREDKDARMEYKNTDLVVAKGSEATTFKSEDDSKKVYAYSVVANVVFGASQNVNLPGTINVKKATPANHEHGKVKEVLFTSTINENRSFYKSVAVIVFQDGYRSIGMTDNDSKTFNFTMSSYTNGVNSTVYTGGKWIPSIAVDENSDGCMVWYDESRNPKRTYDFLSANRNRWNNGHNTVVDVRRSYTIIDGGYGVTLSLNGSAGQTLHF